LERQGADDYGVSLAPTGENADALSQARACQRGRSTLYRRQRSYFFARLPATKSQFTR
jgi:hypothetical protein